MLLPRSIYIKPENGLANRLRCLASFSKIAEKNNRKLFLCWSSGPGFSDERFEDLFSCWPSFMELISEKEYKDASKKYFNLHAAVYKDKQFPELYNYSHDIDFIFNEITNESFCYEGNSCLEYMLPSKFSGNYNDTGLIGRLSLNNKINDEVNKIISRFEHTVGVHIRRGDAVKSPWKKYYRVSTTDSFRKLMDEEIVESPSVKFYLATDCEETQDEIKKQYKDRIISQDKIFFKSENQEAAKPLQKEALIDLMCLSKTKKIIGSYWSSFSDCASKINKIPIKTAIHSYDKNISVIVASKNRTNSLKVCLNSWLRFSEIAEIIIVDWSSDEEIKYLEKIDSRIKVVTVKGKERFHLSSAYNLAARYATKEFILKMDTDYLLSPYSSLFKNYEIKPGEFLTGHYLDSSKDNNCGFLSYLNGMILIRTEDFKSVDGYYEELSGYGYDDCDLYNRLEKSGLKRRLLNHEEISIFHIPHSDEERTKYYEDKDTKESLIKNVNKAIKKCNIFAKNYSSFEKPTLICYPGLESTYNLSADLLLKMSGGGVGNFIHQNSLYKIIKNKKVFARQLDYDTNKINEQCSCVVIPSYDFLSEKLQADDFISFLEKINLPILFVSIGIKSDRYEPPSRLSNCALRIINLIRNRGLPVGARGNATESVLRLHNINKIYKIGCPSNFINEDIALYEKLKNKFNKNSKRVIFNQGGLSDSTIDLERKFFKIFKNGFFTQHLILDFIRDENFDQKKSIKEKIAPQMSQNEFDDFVSNFFRTYINLDQFMEDASRMDLSIGLETHENMAAHQSGCPAIWIHDNIATKELTELMDLPRLSLQDASSCETIEDFKSKCICDYEKCKNTRFYLKNNFIELCKKFGVQIN